MGEHRHGIVQTKPVTDPLQFALGLGDEILVGEKPVALSPAYLPGSAHGLVPQACGRTRIAAVGELRVARCAINERGDHIAPVAHEVKKPHGRYVALEQIHVAEMLRCFLHPYLGAAPGGDRIQCVRQCTDNIREPAALWAICQFRPIQHFR